MDLKLSGKTALVLGASRGLGLASAIELGREGANVMIASSNGQHHAHALAQLREAAVTNADADAITVDVRRPDNASHAIANTVARFGSLDILVNNAGGPPFGSFDTFDDAAWQHAFDLSFMSVARFTRLALPHLRRSGEGRVIKYRELFSAARGAGIDSVDEHAHGGGRSREAAITRGESQRHHRQQRGPGTDTDRPYPRVVAQAKTRRRQERTAGARRTGRGRTFAASQSS